MRRAIPPHLPHHDGPKPSEILSSNQYLLPLAASVRYCCQGDAEVNKTAVTTYQPVQGTGHRANWCLVRVVSHNAHGKLTSRSMDSCSNLLVRLESLRDRDNLPLAMQVVVSSQRLIHTALWWYTVLHYVLPMFCSAKHLGTPRVS